MHFLSFTLLTVSILAQQGLAQESTQCGSLCTQAVISAEQSAAICDVGLLKQLAACNECQGELDADESQADAIKNTQTLIDGFIATCNAQNSTIANFDVSGFFTGLPSTTQKAASTNTAAAPAVSTTPAKTGGAEGLRAHTSSVSLGVILGSLLWSML
ncbi:hypothetical protein C8F01DRAFT_1121778 [Mycena amicta]|nr:hypothetical protein C8F01DRAFT_1121778 [Mycena amicta]